VSSPPGHHAAAHGDIERLEALAKVNRKALHLKDENGWQPIHEAVRGLHKDAVELLIKHGADKNARTGADGRGGSALNLALAFHQARGPGSDDTSSNSIINYLLSIGASNIEPEEEL
jgi:prolyl 4-hydroxylase